MVKALTILLIIFVVFPTYAKWSVEVLDPEEWLQTRKSKIYKNVPDTEWSIPGLNGVMCRLRKYENDDMRVLDCSISGKEEFSIITHCKERRRELYIKTSTKEKLNIRYEITLRCQKPKPKTQNQKIESEVY